jgi:TIR domain
MSKIFLSYRRQDSAAIAGRVYDRLVKQFGENAIFMDVDSIPSGVDFRDRVTSALEQCDVLLAVIGREWEGKGPGRRRIHDPEDFVRIEVQTALARELPVIPIVVDRARMPEKAELPTELEDLVFLNAVFLDQGRHFHHQVSELIDSIKLLLRARKPAGWISAKMSYLAATPARRREFADKEEAEEAERVEIAALRWDSTYDVFISYANEDWAECDIVYTILMANGIRVKRGGSAARKESYAGVSVERCFLLLLSEHTSSSERVCSELHAALDARQHRKLKRIKIFRLDDHVGAIQWASSLGRTNVINKVKGNWQRDLDHLLKALREGPYTKLAWSAYSIIFLVLFFWILIDRLGWLIRALR